MLRLLTMSDLIEHLMKIGKPVECVVWTKSKVTMRKKDVETRKIDNPFTSDVWALRQRVVIFNPEYQEAVNQQRTDENKVDDFEQSKRRWGTTLNSTLVENNGQLYLRCIIKTELSDKVGPCYFLGTSDTVDTTLPANASTVEMFIPKSSTETYQGVDIKVKFTAMKAENFLSVEYDGNEMEQFVFDTGNVK